MRMVACYGGQVRPVNKYRLAVINRNHRGHVTSSIRAGEAGS